MTLDRLEADRLEVVDRGPEADCLGHRRGTGLELVRQLAPRALVSFDRPDHVPPGEKRLHRLEQLGAAPERPHAARPAHLVGRDGGEVAAERLHVHLPVRRSLSRVGDHHGALLVGPRGDLLDRVDRAERVRDDADGNDLDAPFAGDRVELVEPELAVVVEWDHAEAGARRRAMYCQGT